MVSFMNHCLYPKYFLKILSIKDSCERQSHCLDIDSSILEAQKIQFLKIIPEESEIWPIIIPQFIKLYPREWPTLFFISPAPP